MEPLMQFSSNLGMRLRKVVLLADILFEIEQLHCTYFVVFK